MQKQDNGKSAYIRAYIKRVSEEVVYIDDITVSDNYTENNITIKPYEIIQANGLIEIKYLDTNWHCIEKIVYVNDLNERTFLDGKEINVNLL